MKHTLNFGRRLFAGILISLPCIMISGQEPIKLLVRGDDMGIDYGKTLGIIKAYREGILTCASILPTSPYFEESVELCRQNPGLAAGIHITLFGTMLRPVLSPEAIPSLVTPKGFFYEGMDEMEQANLSFDQQEVEREIRAQVGKARASGLNFVYLDWHRGVPETVQKTIERICREQGLVFGQDYAGSIYGYNRITLIPETWPSHRLPDGRDMYYPAAALSEEDRQFFFDALTRLEPGRWMTAVHPGTTDPQRADVTELLCDPRAKEIIQERNIQLISFYDLLEEHVDGNLLE